MTRPDEIPEDVWGVAVRCTGVGGGHEMQGVIQAQRINIARAILAERAAAEQRGREEERERAAKIADVLHGTATGRAIRRGTP